MSFLSYLNLPNLSIPGRKSLNLIDLMIFASYYFFCLLFFLSIFGLFNKEFIIAGLAAPLSFFFFFLRKRVEWKSHYLYFFIFIPILFAGILLIKGYFEGMGMNYLLLWSREITLQEKMP